MPTVFPAALDNFANPAAEDSLASHAPRSHSEMHADLNDAIEAVQREIGVSTNPASGSLRDAINAALGLGTAGALAGVVVSVKGFGAKCDADRTTGAGTDDTAAVQAAINYARTNGVTLYFPGLCKITAPIDAWASGPYSLQGAGDYTGIMVSIADPSKTGVVFSHPTDPAAGTRGKAVVIQNFGIVSDLSLSTCATLVEARRASDIAWRGLFLSHYKDNTALRLSGCWNCDMLDVSVWGAGKHLPRKTIASGVTVSITSGTTTLNASAGIFDAGDVGKKFTVFSSTVQTFTIASYTSAASVEVTVAATVTASAVRGEFHASTGSITSGSNVLTMDGNVFTAADVGRPVYVLGAGAAISGGGTDLLRATITGYTAANQVTLSANAGTTVSGAAVYCSPGVEIYSESSEDTNDLDCIGLHIEQHRGLGLLVNGATNLFLDTLKCHATNNATASGSQSDANAVFCRVYGGDVSGDFEATLTPSLGRVVVTGQNGSNLHLEDVQTIGQLGSPLFATSNSRAASRTVVGNIVLHNSFSGTKQALFDDVTRYRHYGELSGYSSDTFNLNDYNEKYVDWTPVPNFATPGDAVLTVTTAKGHCIRKGDLVEFWAELVFNTNAYTTGAGNFTITGLPFFNKSGGTVATATVTLGRCALVNFPAGVNHSGYLSQNSGTINFATSVSNGALSFWSAAQIPASKTGIRIELRGTFLWNGA